MQDLSGLTTDPEFRSLEGVALDSRVEFNNTLVNPCLFKIAPIRQSLHGSASRPPLCSGPWRARRGPSHCTVRNSSIFDAAAASPGKPVRPSASDVKPSVLARSQHPVDAFQHPGNILPSSLTKCTRKTCPCAIRFPTDRPYVMDCNGLVKERPDSRTRLLTTKLARQRKTGGRPKPRIRWSSSAT